MNTSLLIHLFFCKVLDPRKNEQTMRQALKATPEKDLIVVVQMQYKDNIGPPEILLGPLQNSVGAHILNYLGGFPFSKPICNPLFFFLLFPAQAGVPSSFAVVIFFFFLTINFCILPQRVEKVALIVNWLFGQFCCCWKWIWAGWDVGLASCESTLTTRKHCLCTNEVLFSHRDNLDVKRAGDFLASCNTMQHRCPTESSLSPRSVGKVDLFY